MRFEFPPDAQFPPHVPDVYDVIHIMVRGKESCVIVTHVTPIENGYRFSCIADPTDGTDAAT